MMKPVLDSGVDPIASAAIRTSISCILLSISFIFKTENFVSKMPLNFSIIIKSILSGFLGMALGMSLLLIALQNADAGIVATLSSTSPIIILFLIWLFTKKIPTKGAWIGTILAIIRYRFNFYLLILNLVLLILYDQFQLEHSSLNP